MRFSKCELQNVSFIMCVLVCYKVLIYHQCAKIGSLSFKSYNFKAKSLGKLCKQIQAGSVTLLLVTDILSLRNVVKKTTTFMFCCDSQNGSKKKKCVD